MVTIEGNKSALYQWDINQRLVLTETAADIEVHYSRADDVKNECNIRIPYEENGITYVNIPNALLQRSGIITVYVYVQNRNKAYTQYNAEILVLPREKPADYVYAEDEIIKTLSSLEKRVESLEKGESGGAGGSLPSVTEDDNGKVLKVVEGKWAAEELPVYNGEYSIVPAATEQVLQTTQKMMDANIIIQKVPYNEVTNVANGTTATIL